MTVTPAEHGRGFHVELAMRETDEGEHKGVLKTYMKWLLFKSLQPSV